MRKNNVESAEQEISRLDTHYFNSDLKHVYVRHRDQILSILACIEEIKRTKVVTDFHLKTLEEGVRNSWEEVFYYQAGKFLAELTYSNKHAENLFYKLASDSDFKVRFRIVTILINEPPRRIIKRLLENAFADKSKLVREKAEDVLNRLDSKKYFLLKAGFKIKQFSFFFYQRLNFSKKNTTKKFDKKR